MKVLVAYFSETGNTEKLAKAVFEAVEASEKEILPIQEDTGADGYDVVFIGFPVHSHSVPGKVEAFAKKLADGQKVAYFATHGSMRGGGIGGHRLLSCPKHCQECRCPWGPSAAVAR